MQVGMDIAIWLDLPAWALELVAGDGCGHWHVAWTWLDLSLMLVCY